jgi:hypothetical protein
MTSISINSSPKRLERTAKQIRDDAYEKGCGAAIRDAIRIFKEAERRRKPPKLSTIILQKLAEHPEGISTKDIKEWLKSIDDQRFLEKQITKLAMWSGAHFRS